MYETTKTEEREWTFDDKSKWGDGLWRDEPDKMQWTDETTGLPCLIVRGPLGGLCGYAGVPESHPWFGKEDGQCTQEPVCEERWCEHREASTLDVHGGITFTSECSPHKDNPALGICHVIHGDEKIWWFGFDCGHLMDILPKMDLDLSAHYLSIRDTNCSYKDIGYVKAETTRLADQLGNVEPVAVEVTP